MDLVIVIAIDFGPEDLPGFGDQLDIFSGAGTDESILEPAIRPFDLAFGLGREGITGLDVAFSEDPFPLGIDIIGDQIVLSPERVPTLDEPENGVTVGVIGIGGAIAQNHTFQGRDVVPAGLFFNQLGIKHLPAIIIEAGDKIPLLSRIGGPLVM
jgi:hypothetical protein